MISNQILQSNIEGLKEITRIDLAYVTWKEKFWLPHLSMQMKMKILYLRS